MVPKGQKWGIKSHNFLQEDDLWGEEGGNKSPNFYQNRVMGPGKSNPGKHLKIIYLVLPHTLMAALIVLFYHGNTFKTLMHPTEAQVSLWDPQLQGRLNACGDP